MIHTSYVSSQIIERDLRCKNIIFQIATLGLQYIGMFRMLVHLQVKIKYEKHSYCERSTICVRFQNKTLLIILYAILCE